VAKRVAARGADVALSYNQSRNEAEAAAAGIRAAGRGRRASKRTCRRAGLPATDRRDRPPTRTPRVLVNMASLYAATPFDELNEAAWDRGLAVDLKAAFLCARRRRAAHARGGGGAIINVADWLPASGRARYKGFLPYYVAKSGVIALTKPWHSRWRPTDPRQRRGSRSDPRAARHRRRGGEAVEQATPLGRWEARPRSSRPSSSSSTPIS